MDSARPDVEALVVKSGRIAGIGRAREMQTLAGKDARQVDLKSNVLLPGFVEAHGHPMLSAQTVGDPVVDVRAVHTPTYQAVIEKIKRRVAKAKPGEVVWFTGLDQQLHRDSHEPTRQELDDISADVGIAVQTSNLHAIYLNGAAIAAFGVKDDPNELILAHVQRDEHGRMWRFTETSTGPLMERFARLCGGERNTNALADWLNKYSRAGYTTVCEPGMSPLMMSFYRALIEGAPLPVRVFAFQYVARGGKTQLPVDQGNDRFGVIGTKMWGDGSVLLGNVAVTRPYLNTEMTLTRMGLPRDSTGGTNYSKEDLHWLIDAYAAQGHQLAVHAQGDRTIDIVLDAYEAALAKYPHGGRPFRLEHCGLMRDDQLERAKRLGVACSFFLPMFYYWGEPMARHLLGEERGSRFVPIGSAARLGMRSSYHCDAPMTWPDSMLMLHVATTRKTAHGTVLGADQVVDIDTALKSITIDAAYHIRAEDRLGSLTPGKYADFVVLSGDPRKTPPDELRSIEVRGTYLEDVPVWS
jgi:predicted amidohydrolase YtcJ